MNFLIDLWPLAVIAVLVMIAIGIGMYFEKKRREALEKVAADLGLEFFPQGIPGLVQALRGFALFDAGRAHQTDFAAYLAPCVCDAFIESRRRLESRAAAARAFGYFDDADLHARRARAVEAVAREASSAGLDRIGTADKRRLKQAKMRWPRARC